jgi:hypothetical protein
MIDLNTHIQRLEEVIDGFRYNRYKVLILTGEPFAAKTELARQLTSQLDGTYINCLEEILPNVKKPTLGAYGPMDFKNDIVSLSQKTKILLTIDEVEPLLSTFPGGEGDVVNFFTSLRYVEVKPVVMIVTRLSRLIVQSTFPSERVYCLSEAQ